VYTLGKDLLEKGVFANGKENSKLYGLMSKM